MTVIALKDAVLCMDCDRVSDATKACPACASEHLMNVSKVLNRDPEHGTKRGTRKAGVREGYGRVGAELTYEELKIEYLAMMVALGIAAKESRAKDQRAKYDGWLDEARDRVFNPWFRRGRSKGAV